MPHLDLQQPAVSRRTFTATAAALSAAMVHSSRASAEKSRLDLFPKDLTWRSSLPSPGFAVPGKTKLV